VLIGPVVLIGAGYACLEVLRGLGRIRCRMAGAWVSWRDSSRGPRQQP